MASFLLHALQGIKEDVTNHDGGLRARMSVAGAHLWRFWVEVAYLLPVVPFGISTAILARSLPMLQDRMHERQSTHAAAPCSLDAPADSATMDVPTEAARVTGAPPLLAGSGLGRDAAQPGTPSPRACAGSDGPARRTAPTPASAPQAVLGGGRAGVYVDWGVRYGPGTREVLDVYVPARVLVDVTQRRQQQHKQPYGVQGGATPVVFFSHGGVWASGEAWHYAWLATRLAQAGCVVVCHTYTLFPEALVPQMVQETSRALSWTMDNVWKYGGNPGCITCVGHSAGAHLLALALLHRANMAFKAPSGSTSTLAHTKKEEAAPQLPTAAAAAAAAAPPPPPFDSAEGGAQSNSQGTPSNEAAAAAALGGHTLLSSEEGQPSWREQAAYLHGPGTSFHDAAHAFRAAFATTPGTQLPSAQIRTQNDLSQEQQQQQQQPPLLPHPGIVVHDRRMPARFVGMSGVYDIVRHYEYERARGVHSLSMMGRAMGGPAHFAALSPSLLLHACAVLEPHGVAAGPAAAWSGGSSSSSEGSSSNSGGSSSNSGDGPVPRVERQQVLLQHLEAAETAVHARMQEQSPCIPMAKDQVSSESLAPVPAACCVPPASQPPPAPSTPEQVPAPAAHTAELSHPAAAQSARAARYPTVQGELDVLEGDAIALRSGLAHGFAPLVSPKGASPLPARMAMVPALTRPPSLHQESTTLGLGEGGGASGGGLGGASRSSPAGKHDPHAQEQEAAARHLLSVTGIHAGAPSRLPPMFIMSGCSDVMVPWHEGAQMAACLYSAGVPCRHLIYHQATHACFIMRWPLMKVPPRLPPAPAPPQPWQPPQPQHLAAPSACCQPAPAAQQSKVHAGQAAGQGAQQGHGRGGVMDGLPPFGRDLCAIVLGLAGTCPAPQPLSSKL